MNSLLERIECYTQPMVQSWIDLLKTRGLELSFSYGGENGEFQNY